MMAIERRTQYDIQSPLPLLTKILGEDGPCYEEPRIKRPSIKELERLPDDELDKMLEEVATIIERRKLGKQGSLPS